MRIEGHAIQMASERSYRQVHTKEERLDVWVGSRNADAAEGREAGVQASISELAQQMFAQSQRTAAAPSASAAPNEKVLFELSEEDKMKIQLLEKMMELWTGKPYKISVIDKVAMPEGSAGSASGPNVVDPGWGLHYQSREVYMEQERTSFTASGVIRLADGRELTFSTRIEMSRSYYSETSVDIRAGNALQDPLVLNFGGGAAQLSDHKTAIDLNGDGVREWIPLLQSGSGYLVFDRDGNGEVNDGSELFGPQTGNGFEELKLLDSDGNGWIDEGDAAFGQLYLWIADEQGQPVLEKLDKFRIGALYTDSVSTEFSYKDQHNELLGQLRRTGLFVKENGVVGTLQQIDLKV